MQGISISGSKVTLSRRWLAYSSFILAFCVLSAVRYGLLMYAGQIIFLFCVLLNCNIIRIRAAHLLYLAPVVLYALFSGASYLWCSNTDLYFSAMKSIIQIVVISLCSFLVFADSDDLIEIFEKAMYFSGWALFVYSIITFDAAEFRDILKETENLSSAGNRFGYSIGMHPNEAGFSIALFLVFDVYYFLKKKKVHVLLQIAALTVLMFMTKSRTSILIAAGGILVFMLLYERASIKHVFIFLMAVAVVAVLLFVSLKVEFLYNMYGARIQSLFNLFSGGQTDASVTGRLDLQRWAIMVFKEHPVKGVGIGNFAFFNDVLAGVKNVYAHNNYLEMLADIGLVGTVFYYLPFLTSFFAMIRKYIKKEGSRTILALFIAMIVMILVSDFGNVSYLYDITHCVLAVISAYAFGRSEKTIEELQSGVACEG